MVIPEVRQERLYQKIANLIIKLINDNIFPPGTFLPPERELAKQLGVSRASLREALIVLEISGWIVIQSGNGVIVSDKKHLASDYTIEEILSTRELVDSHCARLAAQNDNVDVINQIEAIYHRMDQAINDNNVHGFYSLDKEFHLAISEPAVTGCCSICPVCYGNNGLISLMPGLMSSLETEMFYLISTNNIKR